MPPPKAGAEVQPVRVKEDSLRREPRKNDLSEIAALRHFRIAARARRRAKRINGTENPEAGTFAAGFGQQQFTLPIL
jgi:hypothetical protein